MPPMSNKISSNHRWEIINQYLTQHVKKQLFLHQFESYEYFMDVCVPEKIYSYNPLIIQQPVENKDKKDKTERMVKLEIYFENHRYEDPTYSEPNGKVEKMYPHDARMRNLTYFVTGLVNLRVNTHYYENGEVVRSVLDTVLDKDMAFGKLPIFLHSKYCLLTKYKNPEQLKHECKYDRGGYTIVNGNEKVVISQEDLCNNRISVFEGKRKVKYDYVASVRSMNKETGISYKTYVMGSLNDVIMVKISHFKKEIPLFVFMRAIGLKSDKAIIRTILLEEHKNTEYLELLEPSVIVGKEYNNYESALLYLSKLCTIQLPKEEKLEYIKSLMTKNIPHLSGDSPLKRQLFVGYMVKHLLNQLLGKRKPSDRDHYTEKRVEPPGMLLKRLFHYQYQKFMKDFQATIIKGILASGFDYQPTDIVMRCSIIDNGFKYSLATGDWNIKVGNSVEKRLGVAQVLNRLNPLASQSHLRRINTPIDESVKLIKPRQLHGTHIGKVCPAETPEGGSVGAVKNMTIADSITVDMITEPIYELLEQNNVIDIDDIDMIDITKEHAKVFINGDLVGFHTSPHELAITLVELRRNGAIQAKVSIRYNINFNEILIYTDYGRCCRPLFIVKNNKINITEEVLKRLEKEEMTWNDLIEEQVIEYIDTEEEECSLIAFNINELNNAGKQQYTHCEIDESFIMLGVCASLIPSSDHNQSPRNAYQSSMCKQAIGIYASNHRERFDTIGYVLSYPQTPLVQNKMSKHLDYDKLPCGQNVIVAFGCFNGYNQEDSVILNKSAIDRGLFECVTYRTHKNEEDRKSSTNNEEKICNPLKYANEDPELNKLIKSKHGDYSKLNEYGFVDLETKVQGNDIIIGKVAPIISNDKDEKKYKDNSISLEYDQESTVDRIIMTRNTDGYKIYKMKVRNLCTPTIGDKVSSRSGQKGTIGMVLRQEDMPFTENGLVPDIIINPHAIPSRMTIGQLIEALLGKYIAATGDVETFDTTAFQGINIKDIGKALHDVGMNKMGDETMINGQTGEEMSCQMFITPTYYQRLKHMVGDKIHSRNHGPVQSLTRQGVEGRSRHGAGRFGEMEKDVMLSHGAVSFLRERFYDSSDAFSVYTCDYCHRLAIVCPVKNKHTSEVIYRCYKCTNFVKFTKVDMAYATKLFYQELEAMAITTEFHT